MYSATASNETSGSGGYVKKMINLSIEGEIITMCSTETEDLNFEIISRLVAEGKKDKEIANELMEHKKINLIYDEVFWEEGDVQKIREDNSFAPQGMKLCPECKSNIKEKATACRFCKNELNNVDGKVDVDEIVVPQSSYQRFSIIVLLASFSVIFHMIFCEWKDEDDYISHEVGKSIIFPFDEGGIYADSLLSGDVMLGLMLGVLLPIILLGISIYLYTGWQKDIKLILKKYGVL